MWAKRHLTQPWRLPKLDSERTWYIAVVLFVICAILTLRFRPDPVPAEPVAAVEVAVPPQPLQIQQVVHELTPPPVEPARLTIVRSELLPLENRLLVVAKVMDADENPVADQVIEWSIDDEGIGEIVDVSRPAGSSSTTQRFSTLLARSRTTAMAMAAEPLGADGITMGPGESWCLVRAQGIGETRVIALAPGIKTSGTREAEVRHRWMPAKIGFPESGRALVGSKVLVSSALVDLQDKPIPGYRVRYILDESSGVDLPGSVQSIDVVTDAAGSATLPLIQSETMSGRTRLRAQLLGAQIRQTANPAILDEAEFAIEWLDPGFQIQAAALGPVRVEDPAIVPIRVTVQGEKIPQGFRLFALLPPELEIPGNPTQTVVELGDPRTFSQDYALSLTTTSPGKRVVRLELRDSERVRATRDVEILHAHPVVRVEYERQPSWHVGTAVFYELRVTNDGPVATTRLRVVDEIPVTLEVTPTAEALRFVDHMEWNIGRLEPGESKALAIEAMATKPVRSLALRTKAEEDGRVLGDAVRSYTAVGMAALAVSVRDLKDPVPLGEEVEYQVLVENRGTAVAEDVQIIGRLPDELEITGVEGLLKTKFNGLEATLGPIRELSPGQSVWCRIRAKAARTGEARLSLKLNHEAVGSTGLVAEESTIIYRPTATTP